MKKIANNSFTEGMIKDLNPLTTPSNVLTDCLNGTVITYNGNEFVLQNDMGNCKVDRAKLSPGFIPLGMKEYAGIVYVASLNPETGVCEIGSFPSPQEDFSTTDFGNIGPANFKTSDFVVDIGDDTINERTVKNLKLFEPELMQLHPGDLYVVLYEIHPIAGGIQDETTYEEYITQDINDRKLFKLKFSKINDNNSLVDLPAGDIKVIPFQVDIEDEYVYYKEPSQATLTVGLELETLDIFDASVVDASRNTDPNKKVGISAIGFGDSLAYFKGVRVNVTSPVTQTFYLEKTANNRKVGAILDDLAANDNFQCTITPYSPYALYPKLTKQFNLTLGKFLSAGSGINNIFTYNVDMDKNFVLLNFDYRFQGNTADGIHLYVEFYDPWSDYSIIKTVDNPTYYGLNNVVVELVDEPRSLVFDSTSQGGTPKSKLIQNTDTDFEKPLLNSTGLIRVDQFLRRNHFYIVRISGVDKSFDADTQLYTYQHYDFYKGLYTNDMFNDVYEAQTTLSVNDPRYVTDFNGLDFDLDTIHYGTTISGQGPVVQPTLQNNFPKVGDTYPLMTNGNFYAAKENYTGDLQYKHESKFETDASYNVALNLEGSEHIFGDLKSNLLSIEFPTLIASDASGSGVKPIIVEQPIPGQPAVNTRADWTVTTLSDTSYIVNTKLITTRNITATAGTEAKTGIQYSEVGIMKSFHYFPDGNGPFNNHNGTITMSRAPDNYQVVDDNGTIHTVNQIADEGPLFSLVNSFTKKYSAFWGGWANGDRFWWWRNAPGDYGNNHNANDGIRTSILFLRCEVNNAIYVCRTHNLDAAKAFLDSIRVASNVTTDYILYYPNSGTFSTNEQTKSTAQFTGANIITGFTPDSSGGVFLKTYLSTFHFQALANTQEFNPTVLNNYINSHKGDSVILDGKQTIRDGFIPFITAPVETISTMVFNDISIEQAANAAVLQDMLNGKSLGDNDPLFNVPQNAKPHGSVYSLVSSYSDVASRFKVASSLANQIITEDNVYIHITNIGTGCQGFVGANGNDKAHDAVDLLLDIQLT